MCSYAVTLCKKIALKSRYTANRNRLTARRCSYAADTILYDSTLCKKIGLKPKREVRKPQIERIHIHSQTLALYRTEWFALLESKSSSTPNGLRSSFELPNALWRFFSKDDSVKCNRHFPKKSN